MATTNLGRVMPVDKGAYSPSVTYDKLDMVHTSDSTYVSKVDNNNGHAVTDTDYWVCYADGKAATTAASLANQKAQYATEQGNYAKAQGDYAKAQADSAKGDYDSLNARLNAIESDKLGYEEENDPTDLLG